MIIIDSTGDANTNRIIIGRGGSKVKGQCKCFALADSRVGVRLIYSDASQGWVTVTSANETVSVVCGASYVTASGGTETTSEIIKYILLLVMAHLSSLLVMI